MREDKPLTLAHGQSNRNYYALSQYHPLFEISPSCSGVFYGPNRHDEKIKKAKKKRN